MLCTGEQVSQTQDATIQLDHPAAGAVSEEGAIHPVPSIPKLRLQTVLAVPIALVIAFGLHLFSGRSSRGILLSRDGCPRFDELPRISF